MNINKKIPLIEKCDTIIENATFKNNTFNFTTNKKEILLYNKCLQKTATIKTYYQYKYISNNLALKNKDNDFIYIINELYQEIDKIKLTIPSKYKQNYIAITETKDKIFLATNTTIISVTKDGYFIKEELKKTTKNKISSYIKKSCNNISYTSNITTINIYCNDLYIAYIKNNSAYISLIKNGEIVNTNYIDENIKINSIINTKELNLLITKHNKYKYMYVIDIKCHCKTNNTEKKNCHEIISSIAHIESALANILNSEGEKIQKIIKISNCPKEILKTNQSVSDTINNISHLESILTKKLDLAIKQGGDNKCQCQLSKIAKQQSKKQSLI